MCSEAPPPTVVNSRPLGTWLVLAFYAALAFQAALTYARSEYSLRDGQAVKVAIPLATKLVRGGALSLELLAAIQLFRLRRVATRWFVAAWLVAAGIAVGDLVVAAHVKHRTLLILITFANLAILTSCSAYAYRLAGRGRLRT